MRDATLVRTSGLHAVTESLVVAGVFGIARWCLYEVGHLLLKLVALAPRPVRLVLDDPLCARARAVRELASSTAARRAAPLAARQRP
ncbi:hypothetical protein JRI60_19355 [Archangium violaceum]|uniref:hypothetical protein n=1 Tax=Archangium violaceum TaxID=83451 RepID=UPI00194F79D6|nr:hypothetical protein [Archangium violaceum]QRO01035.1 hypothetical protein JRI60_19355 [Archangium violaceum]